MWSTEFLAKIVNNWTEGKVFALLIICITIVFVNLIVRCNEPPKKFDDTTQTKVEKEHVQP
jgi:hypothetical protein